MCRRVISGSTMYRYEWRGKTLLACEFCLTDAEPGTYAHKVRERYANILGPFDEIEVVNGIVR